MIHDSKRRRLDEILFAHKLAKDKHDAFVLVTEGRVLVDGQKAVTPAQLVPESATIELRGEAPYVGRGAYKLEAALAAFKIPIAGKVCVDIGAATGGFTQVLLNRGAARVYAIDTARGKLALKLRSDPRVVVMEGTDVRDLASLPELADVGVIDVSLIPLREILPAVRRLLRPGGEAVALFKPQYETRDPRVLHRGVIREEAPREALRDDFIQGLEANRWEIKNQVESPVIGGKGNKEYLFHLLSS